MRAEILCLLIIMTSVNIGETMKYVTLNECRRCLSKSVFAQHEAALQTDDRTRVIAVSGGIFLNCSEDPEVLTISLCSDPCITIDIIHNGVSLGTYQDCSTGVVRDLPNYENIRTTFTGTLNDSYTLNGEFFELKITFKNMDKAHTRIATESGKELSFNPDTVKFVITCILVAIFGALISIVVVAVCKANKTQKIIGTLVKCIVPCRRRSIDSESQNSNSIDNESDSQTDEIENVDNKLDDTQHSSMDSTEDDSASSIGA
ncbi:unnamed protein product [Caenorhabditis bovis]|uniref:Uncharacterized protein n=1 Tax=Caenorhabditis bovis TaxID=2654633 RepID=A0A8S1ERT2_9PELO|nr:unnamed protein product [Caenorhabditis bovis]